MERRSEEDRGADPVRRWEALTASEAAELAAADPVAVLPLAAVEQHGPHLPLSTDAVIGAGIVAEAFRVLGPARPVVALPAQVLGASLEHADGPGTLSLPARVLDDVVVASGRALARAGVRRLVLFSSHGGNRATMDSAALRLRVEARMLVVKSHWARFPRPADASLPEEEWVHGLHGGAVETAMMLHLRPDLVRTDRVRDFPSFGRDMEGWATHLRPEGVASFAWTARDLNPDGVAGDATLATAALGAALVGHYGRCLAELVDDAAAFPLDRLVGPDAP